MELFGSSKTKKKIAETQTQNPVTMMIGELMGSGSVSYNGRLGDIQLQNPMIPAHSSQIRRNFF